MSGCKELHAKLHGYQPTPSGFFPKALKRPGPLTTQAHARAPSILLPGMSDLACIVSSCWYHAKRADRLKSAGARQHSACLSDVRRCCITGHRLSLATSAFFYGRRSPDCCCYVAVRCQVLKLLLLSGAGCPFAMKSGRSASPYVLSIAWMTQSVPAIATRWRSGSAFGLKRLPASACPMAPWHIPRLRHSCIS